MNFFQANDFSLLESCQPSIIAKYKTSNCPEVFRKKGVLKNLVKFTGKPLSQSPFLIKLQLKKRLWHRCVSVNIAKFLRTHFFIKHLRWLPLVKLDPSL